MVEGLEFKGPDFEKDSALLKTANYEDTVRRRFSNQYVCATSNPKSISWAPLVGSGIATSSRCGT